MLGQVAIDVCRASIEGGVAIAPMCLAVISLNEHSTRVKDSGLVDAKNADLCSRRPHPSYRVRLHPKNKGNPIVMIATAKDDAGKEEKNLVRLDQQHVKFRHLNPKILALKDNMKYTVEI